MDVNREIDLFSVGVGATLLFQKGLALGLGPFGTNMLQEHLVGAHLGDDETWFVRRQGTSLQGGGVATMLGWQGGI
jgi:hypothetical protein